MNNEPVAWMYETELQDGTTVKRVSGAWESKYKHISDICDRGYPVPLYTHPAKTLTDEEIATLKEIIRISDRKHDLWDKAKEILK